MKVIKFSLLLLFFIHYYFILATTLLYNLIKYITAKITGLNSKTITLHPHETAHKDVFVSVQEVISHHGYDLQTFHFPTLDARSVFLWRIKSKTVPTQPYPVVMMHGLIDCGATWLMHENKDQTLPYILASRGYEIWVASNRGNRLSHQQHHEKDDQYWNYTIDDMIQFDMPVIINEVLAKTSKQKVLFVGHSQGSIQLLLAMNQHPDLSTKVACFIGMGTVLSMQHLNDHPVMFLVSRLRLFEICKLLGFRRFLFVPHILSRAVGVLAYNSQTHFKLYNLIIRLLCGFTQKNNIPEHRLGVIVTHLPGGASTNNALQWMQCYRTGKMHKFDFGKTKNRILYGSDSPPVYSLDHLKDLPFPVHLFRGKRDAMLSSGDFDDLISCFNPAQVHSYQLQDYNHLDYVWGGRAHIDVYPRVLSIFQNIS